MELTVGSPSSQGSYFRATIIRTVDDGKHLKLQQMFDNLRNYGITNNITTLWIYNDNHEESKRKFDVLLDCLIENNSLYFPSLKRLIFTEKCSYMLNYLKEKEMHLISNTNIDEIRFGYFDQYDVTLFGQMSELNVTIDWISGINVIHKVAKNGVRLVRSCHHLLRVPK